MRQKIKIIISFVMNFDINKITYIRYTYNLYKIRDISYTVYLSES